MADAQHPLIQGLFDALPKPETMWPCAARIKWFEAAVGCFGIMYRGDGSVTVELAPDPDTSKREEPTA